MPHQAFRRSFKTPRGYDQDPGGRVQLFNQTYLAYVKNNEDAFTMGRLQVWIPEFSTTPDDENSWFTVQYCSPFAGATNVNDNTKQGKKLSDTQQSYGWWAVPPDLENQVVVMFINGDPNRGIYIGGLYQQFMNHMVPGIPADNSFDTGVNGANPPVAEYNRWDPDIPNSDNHTRARFDPLHEGLMAQGLYVDPIRGPSDAGARRAAVSKVYGFKSPSGSHLVFDDSDEESYIRIRTKSGAQVLINDTVGYVYAISGNGNSWLEISDDGVDVYSSQSVSMRSQGDMNFHSDGNMNFHANGNMNLYGAANASAKFGNNFDMVTGGKTNITAQDDLNFLAQGSAQMTAKKSMSVKAGSTLGINANGALGVTAGGVVALKGSPVTQNMAPGPQASVAQTAKGPDTAPQPDHDLDAGSGYPDASMETIVSRMPSHEPWSGHPGTKTAGTSGGANGSVGHVGVDVQGNGDEVDDSAPVAVPDDGTKFCMPVSGRGTSGYGFRIHPVNGVRKMHRGIDIGAPTGTAVYASKGGQVIFAGVQRGYGNIIIIDHGNGMTTRYAHLSAFAVRKGAKVTQMQNIGRVGNTGVGTGPHLHFEIRKNGQDFNPASQVPFKVGAATKAGQQK
jgi:murein DD-endopeptidase MepM/ murein hydrolase activator NlpD